MDLSFIEPKPVLIVVHLLGLALGVGGAIMSDFVFFRVIQDTEVSPAEMDFLTLAGRCVTGGLVILVLSGAALFSLDPAHYLASAKFLVKMTIVLVLIGNGILFHVVHLPYLRRAMRGETSLFLIFAKYRWIFLGSGVVSIVSWVSALVLGVFKTIPLPYETILGGYGAMLMMGLFVAYLLRDTLLPIRENTENASEIWR